MQRLREHVTYLERLLLQQNEVIAKQDKTIGALSNTVTDLQKVNKKQDDATEHLAKGSKEASVQSEQYI